MTPPKPPPCSNESLARNDPMYGTAGAGQSWALLEVCGPWGRSALLESPTILDPQLGRAIARRFEKAGMRIAAIRRPGRRDAEPRWRWFLARTVRGEEVLHTGEANSPQGYLDIALDGSDGEVSPDPLVVVCAHGKHDQCCAVRGRGVAAAIAQRYPNLTWECSHLGGDRFAATMLVLPEGLCYGRVDSTDAADLVRRHLEGRLDNDHLRGRTSEPHAVQAAQYFARAQYGDDRIAAFAPLHVDHEEHTIRVLLACEPKPVEVVLAEALSEPIRSMCHASATGRVRTFTLVSLT